MRSPLVFSLSPLLLVSLSRSKVELRSRKKTMPTPFIADGYTRERQIGASHGRAGFNIAWRPMLTAERRRLNLRIVRTSARGPAGAAAAADLAVATVAAQLVEWDLTDAAGRPCEITPASIAELDPELFEELYSTVVAFDDELESEKN